MKLVIECTAEELRALFAGAVPTLVAPPTAPISPPPPKPVQTPSYLLSFLPGSGWPAVLLGRISEAQWNSGEVEGVCRRALVDQGIVSDGKIQILRVNPDNHHAEPVRELDVKDGRLA